jgi:hypothetical protein
MNLKKYSKVKDSGDKALVSKVLMTMDTIITDAMQDDRATQVDKYRKDMSKLIEDGKTTEQDLIASIDDVIDESTRTKLEVELSDKMDWPESLDNSLWDYISHTSEDGQVSQAVHVVINSPILKDEDRVIVIDDILTAYE